jgi:hypothetical protein
MGSVVYCLCVSIGEIISFLLVPTFYFLLIMMTYAGPTLVVW